MNRRKIFILLLLLFVMMTACNQANGPTTDTDFSKGIFYQVAGGTSEMYLFGSIHAGYEEMYPLHSEVEKAFEKSDYLALEIDLLNIDQNELIQEFMKHAFYEHGDKLSDHVNESSFNRVLKIVETAFINKESLDNFKPWYAAQLATQIAMEQTKFSTNHGVEEYFLSNANDKTIIGLENIKDQLYPFSLLSQESNVIFFEESVNDLDNLEDSLDELLSYWTNGDISGASKLRNEMLESAPTESFLAYHDAFINQRDTNMASKLDQLLSEEGSFFVVVGYLHLVGNGSIPELLSEMGYEVNPVFN